MNIWAHIFFFLALVLMILMVGGLFTPRGKATFKTNKFKYLLCIFLLFCVAGYSHDMYQPSSSSSSSQENVGGYEQLGHKINKHNVKEASGGAYYKDKTDSDIRYFTDDDDTITAIKYNYMPDPQNSTSVALELANLLNDSHLKYGNDKVSDTKTLLKGNDYNVYSPKYKKWYHISMQKNDDGKVSTFTVWPGKDSDAE